MVEQQVGFVLAAVAVVVVGLAGGPPARRAGPGRAGLLRDADLRSLQRELDHEERLLSRDQPG